LEELERRGLLTTNRLWQPHPDNKPQNEAYRADEYVDEIGFGGSAGGGKTDLAVGLATTKHKRSLILRREAVQLRGIADRLRDIIGEAGRFNENLGVWRGIPGGRSIEIAGCKEEGDKRKFQGRPHDLIVFDEAPEFLETQADFIGGWARTEDPSQPVTVLYVFNPPTTAEGYWIVKKFAPWLDEGYPNPAKPGEVRWFIKVDGVDEEVDGPETVTRDGETYTPKSRTFIPARVQDNPYYANTGYETVLQNLPEPLRSQMLKGDFRAGVEDDPWQVIPTEWVRLAQERWKQTPEPKRTHGTLGVDVARGGKDKTLLAPRYGAWFDVLQKHPGSSTPDGPLVAALIMDAMTPGMSINLDTLNCGYSVYDTLRANDVPVDGVNFAEHSEATDRSGKFGFINLRAEYWWAMREALDPANGEDLCLPPDNELTADLCAPRWKLGVRGIQIEDKEEVKKRLGRSPDCGDAVVLALANNRAWSPGDIQGSGIRRTVIGDW
jgi:hypothetical protein